MVAELDAERLRHRVVVADVEQLRTLKQDVRQHQDHQLIAALAAGLFHEREELVLALHHPLRIDAGDLADAEVVPSDVEILEIGKQQRLRALRLADGRGEDLTAQLVERDVRDARHALGHAVVARRGRRRFEHDRIGHDGRRHQAREVLRGHESALLIHFGDDRRRRADRLVPEIDRSAGLDIGEAVVVDDGEDIRLFETGHGLRRLVVVDEDDALAPRLDEMEP